MAKFVQEKSNESWYINLQITGKFIMQRKKYKKDYLDKVIIKIDFQTEKKLKSDILNKEIFSSLRTRFPITEEKKLIGREYRLGEDVSKTNESVDDEWHFFGKDREKRLVISQRYMFIEYNQYEYFEQLFDDFKAMYTIISQSHPDLQVYRLGLRYIDKIALNEDNPLEWDEYFKPELNSIIKLSENQKNLARVFHVLDYNFNGEILKFQFGILNPDYPSPIRKKEYILDFDMYSNKLFEKDEIFEAMERFHQKNNELFESVITDKFREHMGVLENE
ncbi:TPA: TIGR04255 family protein [Legionella pneumophila]|nr:TIGR04255 family protein [Legionella pneumophila]HAW6257993.1 TIGR04255 family protein [Legionella pneumophila]HAW6264284.1 TIGR04255 family protein [Legionella pneumophila]HBD7333453.1 TIGR04255 family protein [Legionella pneumophila]HCC0305884.1 TIGR04255 family protein [Legionella pneumophila]